MDPQAYLQQLELRRLQGVSDYFSSTLQAAGLSDVDIDSSAGYDPAAARLSSDPILNSLAQLAAHRLACDRVFISIIDDKHQIIVAEATRSISLYDGGVHAPDDGLCLGARCLDLFAGVCAGTMVAFTGERTEPGPFLSTSNIYADVSRYIINDFALEDKYKDRPYVVGFPHMRYYAEVPIRLPSGEVIGTLAAVDNKPRTGLSDEHFHALRDIAQSIMQYLRLMKLEQEHDRASTLLWGLNTLVQAQETSRTAHGESVKPSSDHDAIRKASPINLSSAETQSFMVRATTHSSSANGNFDDGVTPKEPNSSGTATSSSATAAAPNAEDDAHKTFSNASSILRYALDLDGVVFLDPELCGTAVQNPPYFDHKSRRFARCLGYSARSPPDKEERHPPSIDEVVLRALLQGHPSGTILDFTQPGETKVRVHGPIHRQDEAQSSSTILPPDMEADLRSAIPDITSAVFVPLWSSSKASWLAGGLGWRSGGQKGLEKDDLSYFSVYGATVSAERDRLDLMAIDRAKATFISTISHELRSPLHGILGSAELLRGDARDSSQLQMIDMIENCGHILLETVDHILDYAKINSNISRANKRDGTFNASLQTPSKTQASTNESVFDLDAILERSVDSTLAGYLYSQASQRRISSRAGEITSGNPDHLTRSAPDNKGYTAELVVVLDIEQSKEWTVESETAAWQRIIQNLLGNSLKYTEKGLIEVTLRGGFEPMEVQRMARLTIRDTGRGMATDFMQRHLFTPYAQEDSLSVGTGLGLSIVQNIVKNLGGTLAVQSQVGVGTEIEVLVPLKSRPRSDLKRPPIYPTATLCIIGFESYPSPVSYTGESPVHRSITASIARAIISSVNSMTGVRLTYSLEANDAAADILVIQMRDLEVLTTEDAAQLRIPPGSALLIVNSGLMQATGLAPTERIQYLTQPFGPARVTEAVEAALRVDRSVELFIRNVPIPVPTTHAELANAHLHAMHSVPPTVNSARTPPEAPTEGSVGQGIPPSATRAPINLLLVDDNKVNLRMLVVYAEKLSCSYRVATNGQEAVDEFIKVTDKELVPFDYILMDVSMPVLDGFGATRAIRGFEEANNLVRTPIIALTGLGGADARREALVSGMDLFWTKPVPLSKIKELISKGD